MTYIANILKFIEYLYDLWFAFKLIFEIFSDQLYGLQREVICIRIEQSFCDGSCLRFIVLLTCTIISLTIGIISTKKECFYSLSIRINNMIIQKF